VIDGLIEYTPFAYSCLSRQRACYNIKSTLKMFVVLLCLYRLEIGAYEKCHIWDYYKMNKILVFSLYSNTDFLDSLFILCFCCRYIVAFVLYVKCVAYFDLTLIS
jgi:hypothetical protein